jgi:hypothetical protein
MKPVVAVFLACACGGPAATPAIKPPPPANRTVATSTTFQPDRLCTRLSELKAQQCSVFADLDMAGCPKLVKDGYDDPSNRPMIESVNECTTALDTCSDVVACMDGSQQTQQLRKCAEKSDELLGAAVGMPHDAWLKASKRGFSKFSQVKSSKAAPVEVCGIPTENAWLATLACDDGSHPLVDNSGAETARVGNLGDGGRCNSIIDLYRVKCPEASYDIYLDGYVCPQP